MRNHAMNLKKHMIYLFFLFLSAATTSVWSKDEANKKEENSKEKKEVFYYDLDPEIVANYQKETSRRLGHVNIDIQFQVSKEEYLDTLEEHKPLLDHTIIDVLNKQTKETIHDQTKRKNILDEIKKALKAVLKEEVGEEIIEEAFFTKFMYH